MRIVYMGTPDFAVTSLKALLAVGHQIVAVVTQPDKPKGRGKQVQPPPVKVLALEHNLPVLQPTSIKTVEFLQQLQALEPDCIVVVAYGKILPPAILNLPPKGCINVHASLLPYYRGSAPIHWAVINGERETGVTTMFMNEGMDTGDMILKKSLAIGPEDNVGLVHDRLAHLGAEALVETIELLEQNKAPRIPQDHSAATYAPMLHKEHEEIHWDRPAVSIHNHVRGMDPWPGAFTTWQGKVLKIWRTKLTDRHDLPVSPGTVVESLTDGLLVQTGEGQLLITELQLQGSRRMGFSEFLRGKKIMPGTVLGNIERVESK
ncbi:Methionyl-tRNA formyltransferase [Desulfotomaculum nigrificans CO-1-SRB]|uniref:Methionyl-tRNA formyltransferase n=1 Tax=Desulfotomaculum nigrificans (strain DSM 14880 / VKM B-2319 / CO-1-SRB) TaxID=868595 RepID=F6B4N2_DESCC|nr:methionyl-tRNA formyltransferase [Desulfotomaculum nigrificans]AEF94144.1 Methionyl-tRNA formyltransferase [Desulfotomaculum nigrificans CO-1-SRB]